MSKLISKKEKRERRHRRVRAKVFGTAERPRLAIFCSNKEIYCQVIDDDKRVTLISANSFSVKEKKMMEKAKIVGELIGKLAKDKKITKVVFDRAGYVYTGRVKAFAESARAGGLIF